MLFSMSNSLEAKIINKCFFKVSFLSQAYGKVNKGCTQVSIDKFTIDLISKDCILLD